MIRIKRRGLYVFTMIVPLVLGVLILWLRSDLHRSEAITSYLYILLGIAGVAMTGMGIAIALYWYLQGYIQIDVGRFKKFEISTVPEIKTELEWGAGNRGTFDELKRSVEELRLIIGKQQSEGIGFSDDQREEMLTILKERFSEQVTDEFVKGIEKKYSAKIIKENKHKELHEKIVQIRMRLLEETYSLSRRANLNLLIGTLTTVAGVGILVYIVLSKENSFVDLSALGSYYIPRLSLVIFIEIFAYFFLKLYKSNLADIKYFQNELTNVETKIISLDAAVMSSDKESLRRVIDGLSKTERNFFLMNRETTEELEKIKLETSNLKELVSFMGNIFRKVTHEQ